MKSKKEVSGNEVYQEGGRWYWQHLYKLPDTIGAKGPFKSFNQAYSNYRQYHKEAR